MQVIPAFHFSHMHTMHKFFLRQHQSSPVQPRISLLQGGCIVVSTNPHNSKMQTINFTGIYHWSYGRDFVQSEICFPSLSGKHNVLIQSLVQNIKTIFNCLIGIRGGNCNDDAVCQINVRLMVVLFWFGGFQQQIRYAHTELLTLHIGLGRAKKREYNCL